MRVTLKRLLIDGSLRWAEAQVQAIALPSAPGGDDSSDPLSVKPGSRRRRRPVRAGGGRRSVICVRVKVRLTAGDTLAQIRERARDEALRYLDVA